jgi:hypothetical protein
MERATIRNPMTLESMLWGYGNVTDGDNDSCGCEPFIAFVLRWEQKAHAVVDKNE